MCFCSFFKTAAIPLKQLEKKGMPKNLKYLSILYTYTFKTQQNIFAPIIHELYSKI